MTPLIVLRIALSGGVLVGAWGDVLRIGGPRGRNRRAGASGITATIRGRVLRGLLMVVARLGVLAAHFPPLRHGRARSAPSRTARDLVVLQRTSALRTHLAGVEPDGLMIMLRGVRLLELAITAATTTSLVFAGDHMLWPAIPAACIAVLPVPAAVVHIMARRRRRQIEASLPVATEILAGAVGAGLAWPAALRFVATAVPSAAAVLLRRSATLLEMGGSPEQALIDEGRSCELPSLVTIGVLLARHRESGAPVADALRRASETGRARRRALLVRRAGRAAPTAALLSALLVAPACVAACVLLLVGGLVLRGTLPGLR